MTPAKIRDRVVAERVSWIRRMLIGIRSLPSDDQVFRADPRNQAAAESFLRRALEALLDLGRHVLAKGFGRAVVEYKDIAVQLGEVGVLDAKSSALLRDMAGYRNRMVHFYDEIGTDELLQLVRGRLTDVEQVLDAIVEWLGSHRELVDRS